MDLAQLLPTLLGAAWLLPLASFVLIVFLGPRMGKHGKLAGVVATGAILGSFVLSLVAFFAWVSQHKVEKVAHHAAATEHAEQEHDRPTGHDSAGEHDGAEHENAGEHDGSENQNSESHGGAAHGHTPVVYTNDWYTLGEFGRLKITISYYIDALTICMFCMVTLIATCIHFYANGYMHDELHDVTDHEVTLADGRHLHRHGRFYRFFQYLSLFCFSMLGIVIAGNIAMVFVFWELVGICSYFLIGFYIERKSASNAANKAFIVNRVGDFGMIIGLMALWGSLGTFSFGDTPSKDGEVRPGLFSLVRGGPNHEIETPDGMVKAAMPGKVAAIVVDHLGNDDPLAAESEIHSRMETENWRDSGAGYWLLVIAGIGIFCGCIGKSAQFPLHVWLPDAMEGPTPVSALVHSATMVAAGVYLTGRFFPVFTPEVLLVIGYVGAATLILAASIAITATDIKRVLAYSTVSQLGYMMLALGMGGWLAGLFHLITHAFFKSLLFLCSGSVIHACHTNEMPKMGGLLKKMPWTGYTMLVGCLAIMGAGVPFLIGMSGYYSKDGIIAQALSFRNSNSLHGSIFFGLAAGGAAITAFYMFRLWYMTFLGKPRDHHIFDHAHESPRIMYVPLVILAVFAVGVAWNIPFTDFSLVNLLEQARPAGEIGSGVLLPELHYPNEHASHEAQFHIPATLAASGTALAGFLLATVFYAWRLLNPTEVRQQFSWVYRCLINKWYFDEIYQVLFIKPAHVIAKIISRIDKKLIDRFIDSLARFVRGFSRVGDGLIDRFFVDGAVNLLGNWTYSLGRTLRGVQTGQIRQYVMLIVIATVVLTMLISAVAMGH